MLLNKSVIVRPELPAFKDDAKAGAAVWLLGNMVHHLATSANVELGVVEAALRSRREAATLPTVVATKVAMLWYSLVL